MSDVVIRAEGLGKSYVIGHQSRREPYTALRDVIARGARTVLRKASDMVRGLPIIEGDELEQIWALRDIDFEIRRGEVVGIIGRNGAGKSTLLKILSRITEPSTGTLRMRGRVASLLEVGTGFHPELTGRENIFLNGAILGMSRGEIGLKFDEIVDFAEVERFLDTPVKRYSSGMYVRLAFAVAAHLEPEILIVDEVLAVGDAQFQRKCLGKMEAASKGEGRTVILVSHNMAVIQSLCSRTLYLESGRQVLQGETRLAVARYLAGDEASSFTRKIPEGARCAITGASVTVSHDQNGPWIHVEASFVTRERLRAAFETRLHDAHGQAIAFGSLGTFEPEGMVDLECGETSLRCRFHAGQIANGRYGLTLKLGLPFIETIDQVERALSFELECAPPPGASHRPLQSWGVGSFLFELERLT